MSKLIQRNVRALCLGALLATAPALSYADDVNSDAVKQLQMKLDQSLKMIDALANRVRELESKQTSVTSAATAPTASSAQSVPSADEVSRLQAVEQKVSQIEVANASHTSDDTGLPIHGFADVNIGNHNPFHPYEKGASLNNFDMYLTPKLGGKWLALFELDFEVDGEGSVGVDIERGQIGYQFSDAATLWVGRFHTPYGYVNTALHHGVWLNDALRRPSFLMFEDQGGVMPAHTVGALLSGGVRAGDGKVLYDAFVGNGQKLIGGILDMRVGGSDSGRAIYGGRAGYQWTSGFAEGLTLGASALDTHIDDDQNPQSMTEVRIGGVYGVYDTDNWEVLAEGYIFSNLDVTGSSGTHRSNAYFAQAGYRLPGLIPYVRYEHARLDQTDQYFAQMLNGGSYHRSAVGLRHDINPKIALKFEVAQTHYTDRVVGQFNEFLSQLAIRF